MFPQVNSHNPFLPIHISGGAINDVKSGMAAFDAREMNYLIMIEGKWNAVSRSREEKDKEKVISKY